MLTSRTWIQISKFPGFTRVIASESVTIDHAKFYICLYETALAKRLLHSYVWCIRHCLQVDMCIYYRHNKYSFLVGNLQDSNVSENETENEKIKWITWRKRAKGRREKICVLERMTSSLRCETEVGWSLLSIYSKNTINHLPHISEREFVQQNYDLHGQRKEKKKYNKEKKNHTRGLWCTISSPCCCYCFLVLRWPLLMLQWWWWLYVSTVSVCL